MTKKEKLDARCVELLESRTKQGIQGDIARIIRSGAIDVESWEWSIDSGFALPRVIVCAALADLVESLEEEMSAEDRKEYKNVRCF